MKRLLFVFLLLCCAALLYAGGVAEDGLYKGVTDRAFAPVNTGNGEDLESLLFVNQAPLSNPKLKVVFPYVVVSSYNFSKAVNDKAVATALANITRFKAESKDLLTYLLGLASSTGYSYNRIVSADAGLGVQYDNYGFGFNAVVSAQSMPAAEGDSLLSEGSSFLDNGYVALADYGLTFAYGRRVLENEKYTLDVGGAVRYLRKAYLCQLNFNTVSSLVSGESSFDSLPARGGFAFPLDLSADLGMFDGKLRFQVSANNLNGFYYMADYPDYKEALQLTGGSTRYVMYSPFSLNTCVSYSHDYRYVRPSVYFAFSDIFGFVKDTAAAGKRFEEVFRYLDTGVKVKLADVLDMRVSYRHGYMDFALGLGYCGNMFELSYGFEEYGSAYGAKPVDRLSVKFTTGYSQR